MDKHPPDTMTLQDAVSYVFLQTQPGDNGTGLFIHIKPGGEIRISAVEVDGKLNRTIENLGAEGGGRIYWRN